MKRVKKLQVLLLSYLLGNVGSSALVAMGNSESGGAYPQKNINFIVGSSAGGGTDLSARAIAAVMEKELGSKIMISNVPGGAGGAAASQVFRAPSDGHNVFVFTEGMYSFNVMGVFDQPMDVWSTYIIGGTPSVISVAADSPYKNLNELIAAAKSSTVSIANSSTGCIWDVKATLLGQYGKFKYKFIPYNGSNPSILAALNGEVDAVLTGVGEQSEYLAAKKLRPLAVIEPENLDLPGYPNIPSVTQFIPDMANMPKANQAVMLAIKKDTPDAVKNIFRKAFEKALTSSQMKEFAKQRYMSLSGLSGDAAKDYNQKMVKLFSWIVYDKGIAPNSPEKFGIPRN